MPRGSAPGERRGGRAAGTPNKFTADVKALILGALSDVGGQEYLARQAEANPAAFMSLLGKVLPTQLTGADGGPMSMQVVTGVPRDDDAPALSEQEWLRLHAPRNVIDAEDVGPDCPPVRMAAE